MSQLSITPQVARSRLIDPNPLAVACPTNPVFVLAPLVAKAAVRLAGRLPVQFSGKETSGMACKGVRPS